MKKEMYFWELSTFYLQVILYFESSRGVLGPPLKTGKIRPKDEQEMTAEGII